jgi:hypothetical protein
VATGRKGRKHLTVAVDARLADDYREAYTRAFGRTLASHQSLSEFIAGFVEDRLIEEIKFARAEAERRPR